MTESVPHGCGEFKANHAFKRYLDVLRFQILPVTESRASGPVCSVRGSGERFWGSRPSGSADEIDDADEPRTQGRRRRVRPEWAAAALRFRLTF